MAGAKKEDKQIVTLAKLRDQAVVTAQEIRRGIITPNVGNAVLNGYRTAAYIEQVRLAKDGEAQAPATSDGAADLSPETRERLDEIIKLLSSDKEGS
jgi:hypothetical protein